MVSIPKLTGDMIRAGTNFVKTIELKSLVYGQPPDYKIAVDIRPISRSKMREIFRKYGITADTTSALDIDKADEMMTEVCRLGIVDQAVVELLGEMHEFLPMKIGAEILALSTGTGIDLENFSEQKKA
ncbi:MAG TPA: hypothetical protein PK659_07460 [Methanothrix sp.]|nr:hypothetical protein [Methanothrix sp.]HOL44069.1 hypothetical protein [Methanothrix sp.]